MPGQNPRSSDERYAQLEELGRGGAGLVVAAEDSALGRTVALKTLRAWPNADRDQVLRFLEEARVTGRLEHPGIVPIYDLGVLPDGQPFYTMRIVERRSLRDVLKEQGSLPRGGWPLARVCGVLLQVSRAVAYAHSRGVIHRDLKPENILLGRWGEVYVADWGIAKQEGAAPPEAETDPTGATALGGTQAGTMLGTAGYMSPEQARGEPVDGRSDVFSLGVILYELLVGKRPFGGTTWFAILKASTESNPDPPRVHWPECPLVLEDLCMRMLRKSADDRPPTADAVADEIEAFLEGVKEQERRAAESLRLVGQARDHAARYESLCGERDRLLEEAARLLRDRRPWDPSESKHAGWALEERGRAVDIDASRVLASTIECYSSALHLDPKQPDARRGLADIHWLRATQAESARDAVAQAYHEAMVRDYDDGRHAALLSADAFVTVRSRPPGAEVLVSRYVERHRILSLGESSSLGETPTGETRLEAGSYLFVLRRAGMRDTRVPVHCGRGEHRVVDVDLHTDAEIGEGFVYVPGGPCILGGDPEAHGPLPRRVTSVDGFAIARFPVTFGEYLAFIDDLWARDRRQAEKRLPSDESDSGPFAEQRDGRWVPLYDRIVEGDARAFCPPERAGDLPLQGIDWFDAVAYCRWRSEKEGVAYRLPAELEWEKAARGVDGRFFPWGDRFDATFCKMRESRPGYAQPEPVGAFPVDESPYGVRDMAGGMRQWVADVEGSLSAQAALADAEPSPGRPYDGGVRAARGGVWGSSSYLCRPASRRFVFPTSRLTTIGMRLARKIGG